MAEKLDNNVILSTTKHFSVFFNGFSALPEKAKEMWFCYFCDKLLGSIGSDFYYNLEFNTGDSPIEKIFYVCYYIFCDNFFSKEKRWKNHAIVNILFSALESQTKIKVMDKTYIADFTICFEKYMTQEEKKRYPKLLQLKYVIELDGYDYHSNKQQMEYDYKRENDLKSVGYTVIRFTGSQIYKDCYSCMRQLFIIIISDLERIDNYGNI